MNENFKKPIKCLNINYSFSNVKITFIIQLQLNITVYTKYKTLNTQNELIMHWYPCIENTKEEKNL